MSYAIRPATRADGNGILDLLRRTPQEGLIHLSFERDPDFFIGACVSCEEPDIWVAEDAAVPGRVAAVFNIGVRSIYINGVPQSVRYAHDLRIDPEYRGGMLLHRMFRHLRRVLTAGEWMQTVILDGNDASLSTVGSGRAGLPVYYPCGEIETSLLYTASAPTTPIESNIAVRRATRADIGNMQAFLNAESVRRQFFPQHDLQKLLADDRYYTGLTPASFLLAFSGETLVGMLGDWDQAAFKKTRVVSYPGVMHWLRYGYNAVSALTGGMRLPASGDCFRYRSLHTVVVANNDATTFRRLLDAALFENRDCDAVVCGLFSDDPLAPVLRTYRRRVMHSNHFLVSYDGDPRAGLNPGLRPYVEVARL